MVVVAVLGEEEGVLTVSPQELEVQEVLAVLGEEAVAVGRLVVLAREIMVVMVQQEVMAEVEGAAVLLLPPQAALVAMVALVALD